MTIKKISGRLLVSILLLSMVSAAYASTTDPTHLPLGDGKVSTSPKVGYVYSCGNQGGGGGAQTVGSWIHGSTWNLNEKLKVQGSVSWPAAQFTINAPTASGRVITGNGLPVDSVTGTFPIASTDPAYQVDRNPNTITTQSVSYTLPTTPTVATSASCVPMGPIGIALNGVAIFNALDAENRDAVANEVQDVCSGHPERSGLYHYHGPSSCLPHQNENNALVGYAIDGFGIYSNHDAQGNEIATKDLDECHGTTSEVMWDGKKVLMYHYVITQDYPYTVGCLKGTAVTSVHSPNTVSVQVTSLETTTVPSGSALSSNLSVGSDGSDVVVLQTTLQLAGYLTMPAGVKKGHFGGATRDALKKYQKAHGITQTGTFGPKTRAFYNSSMKTTNTSSSKSSMMPLMKDQSSMKGPQSGMPIMKPSQSSDGTSPTSNTQLENISSQQGYGGAQSSGGMMPTPPPEAITACDSVDEGGACSFVTPNATTITGSCRAIGESLACVPAH